MRTIYGIDTNIPMLRLFEACMGFRVNVSPRDTLAENPTDFLLPRKAFEALHRHKKTQQESLLVAFFYVRL